MKSNSILTLANEFFTQIQASPLDNDQKIKLYKGLQDGLQAYKNRLSKKLKLVQLITCGLVKEKDTSQIALYIAALRDEQMQLQQNSDLVTKTFQPFPALNLSMVFTKPILSIVLDSLKHDPLISKILEAWHRFNVQSMRSDSSLLDCMYEWIQKGTCYGQAMKILELLGSKDHEAITDDYICSNMNKEHCIRYQIMLILQVFVTKHDSAYICGVPTVGVKKRLEACFPHYQKKSTVSEMRKLQRCDREIFIARVADFIKIDIQSHHSKHDFAVIFTFYGKKDAHAAIVRYSQSENRFFWYDPYYSVFLSTKDQKLFFKAVADELMRYKDEELFETFQLTAYKL